MHDLMPQLYVCMTYTHIAMFFYTDICVIYLHSIYKKIPSRLRNSKPSTGFFLRYLLFCKNIILQYLPIFLYPLPASDRSFLSDDNIPKYKYHLTFQLI